MKTTLNVCSKCNCHATFKFEGGDESTNFCATEAVATLVQLTKERKISYSDAGRLLIEISSWIENIPDDTWAELIEGREMMNFLQSAFGGPGASVFVVDIYVDDDG